MRTQYFKSNGEVMLSRWWKTPSARAAFRRAKQATKMTPEAKKRLKQYNERKKAL